VRPLFAPNGVNEGYGHQLAASQEEMRITVVHREERGFQIGMTKTQSNDVPENLWRNEVFHDRGG